MVGGKAVGRRVAVVRLGDAVGPVASATVAGFSAAGAGRGWVTALRASALIWARVRVMGGGSGRVSAGFGTSAGARTSTCGEGSGAGGGSSAFASFVASRKCCRTLSATSPSMALECDLLSVMPSSRRKSRIALLLISISRARSLIRMLLLTYFFASPTSERGKGKKAKGGKGERGKRKRPCALFPSSPFSLLPLPAPHP